MKKTVLTIGCIISSLMMAVAGEYKNLQPESCTIGDRLFTSPLYYIGFYFDGGINLLDGASATVKCEGEVVANATDLEVSNYRGEKRTQGSLSIIFDEQNLPKGRTYTICIAPGSISWEDDADIMNAEITQSFEVPENLGPSHIDMEDGSVISTVSESIFESFPTFYWSIETEPVGNPYFILYREGIPVREIPAYVTWDWDLGQAYAKVNETMNFQKGVHFTLKLPAGSAHAMLREDIVNDEVEFNFVGGYMGYVPTISYDWCSLYDNHSNVLDEVTFTYNCPIHLAEHAVIQLWYADGSELIKEAPAYINTDANCWTVSANFGGYEMTSEKGYTLIIPDGTIIADSGDPIVNHRCSIPISSGSGINKISINAPDPLSSIYDLNGRKVTAPIPGEIYVKDGKTFVFR